MKEINKNQKQKGFAVLTITFFALIIMLSIALAMGFAIIYRQQSSTDMVKSAQAYYAAEAGIEDALLRLKNNPAISSLTYDFDVNGTDVDVAISETIGMSKAITSGADNSGISKNIITVCSIEEGQSTSFYYGVQVGEGGLVMENGSRVMGNVFSGGNISGGSGIIDNDAIVSGNGNSIDDVHVKGNVLAYSCLASATVDGDVTCVDGGTCTCQAGGTKTFQPEEIEQQPMPIPQSQIDEWKDAAATDPVTGNVTITSGGLLGPKKIDGNLTINGGVTLTITGTVYVTGDITFQNNVTIKLDPSYGARGEAIICDGKMTIHNNDVFLNSGQEGSYLILISTSTDSLAIDVQNNAEGAVLYTTNGGVIIYNNVSVTEVTGYKVTLQNNAEVQYSSGLVNIYFSGGPGAGWRVSSWQEQ